MSFTHQAEIPDGCILLDFTSIRTTLYRKVIRLIDSILQDDKYKSKFIVKNLSFSPPEDRYRFHTLKNDGRFVTGTWSFMFRVDIGVVTEEGDHGYYTTVHTLTERQLFEDEPDLLLHNLRTRIDRAPLQWANNRNITGEEPNALVQAITKTVPNANYYNSPATPKDSFSEHC